MCFVIDRDATAKLRKSPPTYGFRLYQARIRKGELLFGTPVRQTPMIVGVTRARRGKWRDDDCAKAGVYCYRHEDYAHGYAASHTRPTISVRVKVVGRIRYASPTAFTCDAIEISDSEYRRAVSKLEQKTEDFERMWNPSWFEKMWNPSWNAKSRSAR